MKPTKYNKESIFIHWLTAGLILVLFPLGNELEDADPSIRIALIAIHIVLGIVVLILSLFRSWQVMNRPQPAPLDTGSAINNALVKWVHRAFYFLLFAISISGIITVVAGQYHKAISKNDTSIISSTPGFPILEYHDMFSKILMLLLVMHVVGVIKHYLIKKENPLKRIT